MKKKSTFLASALSMALLASFLSGCGGDSPEKLIASSKEFLAKNDSKAAVIQLKNALQQDPNLGEARFLLGKALFESGDFSGAEVELRKAIERKFDRDQAVPLLAKAMLASGQAKKLIDEFGKTTLSAGEPQANLLTTLSSAYGMQGNRTAADTSLKAALEAKPDYEPAQLSEARLLASNRQYDQADSIVQTVLTKNPKNFDAYLLSGGIRAAKGDLEGALVIYRKAIEGKPDLVQAHAAAVGVLFKQQKLDEAIAQIEAMKKVAPKHPQTIYLDAQASYQRKDFNKTRELTQQLLRFSPNNASALQLAGAAEFQLRSYIQAETYLSKALQQAPDSGIARQLLTSTYLRNGQAQKALSVLEPVLDKIDKDPAMLALAGQVFLESGDARKSADFFARASKLDPDNASKKTALAIAHIAQGSTSAGFDELEQISQTDKGTTADLALVAAYLKSNQTEKALQAIEVLDRKQPDNPATYNLKGRTLLTKKDVKAARGAFEKALSLNPTFMPAAASLAALDLADKKPDEASKRFENILSADPKNTQALLALAEIRATNGGTTEEVAGLIKKAISANPTEILPRLALIQFYLTKKDNKAALGAANEAHAAVGDKPEILDALGRTQQLAGETNQAVTTYGKLASLQPALPVAQMRLAEIHLANKNRDEAAKSLKKALEIKPDLLDAQRALIQLALEAKKPGEALTIARQVQSQRPKEATGFAFEGDIHTAEKKWPDAINAYRNGLKQSVSPELAIKLYSTLLASGSSSEADKMATSWNREHPKDVSLTVFQGDLATSRKEYPLAAQRYQSALQSQPNNPLILNNLAWVSGQLKSPKALEYAEKANQLSPNQPPFMDTLAMILAEKGEAVKAVELLRQAMAIAPQAASIQLNLARVLISSGKKEEARKELDALAKLGEKFPEQAEVAKLQKAL